MQFSRLFVALGSLALIVGSLHAQSLTLTTNANLSQNPDETIRGVGTATVTPGGAANVVFNVTGSGDDNCSETIQAEFTATLTGGDKLNLRIFGPGASNPVGTFTLNGTFIVLGGTGQYAGKGGSGTAVITANFSTATATVTLNGTLNNQPTLTASIKPSGVVPVYSKIPFLQPGSWVSVYGDNLANATTLWDNNFPTSLGGVTVTVNSKPAFLWFVSAGQINMQLPDDTKRGCVEVKVNTPNGSATIQAELGNVGPSLSLLDAKYPAAIIITTNGSGAYGGGNYDIAGSPGRYSYNTRKVKKGEDLVLFGVGFGPTNPPVPSGQSYSGDARVTAPVSISIGGIAVQPSFFGLTSAGLYQANIKVPLNVVSGDQLLRVSVAGRQAQDNIFLTIE